MKFEFAPMTIGQARTVVEHWKYPGEYSIYDYSNEADHILDPAAWGVGLFAVLDGAGALVGELSIEFFDEAGRYTEYEEYPNTALLNSREMWIGFGLRPDLVGQGLGSEFAAACTDFATTRHDYRGEYVRLGVAEFNIRAIKAYQGAGYEIYEHVKGTIAGREYECVHMRFALDADRKIADGA